MKKAYLLIFWMNLLSLPLLKAQDTSRFSFTIKDKPYPELIHALESTTKYTFYYDSKEMDSLHFSVDVHGLSMREILYKIFQNTKFHYSIDSYNRVFVSLLTEIFTDLSPNFFYEKNSGSNSTLIPNEVIETPISSTKIKTSLNNKLYEIGIKFDQDGKKNARLVGYVKDINSGEGVLGASITWDNNKLGVLSDQFGYYTISLLKGLHTLYINSSGMQETKREIKLNSDGRLDITMQEFISTLKTVTVTAEKGQNVQSLQMGVSKLNTRQIRQVPVVFGEADIIKVVLTLPGVTSVGEASNGFNVRGGSTDQNLILFGDATIYNPSHLFGFFSAFNPDVVKGIELYKSAIPEKYGGRLSSVLDLTLQDGNKKRWAGNIAIGPITGKITLQGPIQKDKTSLILGLRTTYSDWLLRAIGNNALKVSSANFNDGSIRINHIINDRNSVYLSGYFSNDRFRIGPDTLYKYSNLNTNLKWKHNFNNKSFGVFTLGLDHYQYDVSSTANKITAFDLGFKIKQDFLRSDLEYSPNEKHTFSYGLNAIYYSLQPGSYTPLGISSLVIPKIIENEQGLETALYFGDQYSITNHLLVNLGIRYSLFNYLGSHTLNQYVPKEPRDTSTIVGTKNFGSGQNIQTYSSPEIRLALRYSINTNTSLKISYNTLQQYIHLLSNTVAISPTDIWKLSDPNIKPQKGNQWSLGYYANFSLNTLETSIEIYYKTIKNYLDYKSGASLLLNPHIETEVINTQGKAYGIEFLIKKTSGKLNGWFSYAYSRTFLKVDDPIAGQTINHGDDYPASFDKPHNLNFIGNYRFTHRYSMSLNTIYGTGRPITLPIATFILGGANSPLYSDRNQYRVPDYFRMDVSFTLDGNHRIHQRFHDFWAFGVYNITGRENAYSNYFTQVNGKIKGYQLSIFGSAIPFLTYNIQF